MKRIIGPVALSIAAMFALVGFGCGGGGGGGDTPPVTPPSQSLQGTYSLVGFDLDYSNGTTINENSPVITSWSGTMKIGTDTISQSFVINNTPFAATGTATITWTTAGVAGIAHITDQTGTHDVAFTISGNNLTTYSGVMDSGTPGITVEEYDHWNKISDSLSPEREGSVTEKSDEQAFTGKHWIAELFVP